MPARARFFDPWPVWSGRKREDSIRFAYLAGYGIGHRVSPQDRHVGYMSQDYALFPTYTVAGNVEYGLAHLSSHERKARVTEVLDLFNCVGWNTRSHNTCPVASNNVWRWLEPWPHVLSLLLLDEPLSALDGPTRTYLRDELRRLLKQLALPSIIVTHDWAEALTLGDLMAVVSGGEVLQTGPPLEVFSRPRNAEVALVVGVETVVKDGWCGRLPGCPVWR